ncbi:glycine cleavage system aminomethyltransferase GcvT [Candidatus Aminicenantes bacterium AC-708-M15]|jgi:aminomethyltransferase|nr:glycine cleavage system aminomethyltransferase GcvT [SCandidatus Aminicenantes bacterium Aminicenantia_JdfR_composite]MCP2596905.1 glycine cleavage system aminomethyltransferase GcvT [Candidatus Aminicenantes bacterium AC-335-G13]MCP2604219.1 glycine cleavage system aminomethyltransferase GcvT [Candidatus Aminicenantes bacterium AC-708-M15]MCP2618816.1 glycine cleavage system aminomethyltransferase GcvT [Candidatus Aminicenantes bacterium AC-335-A11]
MKKTRLNKVHKELGGKMIEFAGYEMPVEYEGIILEHLAVREKAGIFDVSHMGEIIIKGDDALDLIQYLTPNDASRLVIGKAQYSALTTPKGTFVDDLLVYRLDEKEYMLVVNAINSDKDYEWILKNKGKFSAEVRNESDNYTQIALQGPKAQEILQPLTNLDLSEIKYYWFKFGKVAGIDSIVSRTGYTGEDGFEIYTTNHEPEKIWYAITEEGKKYGLKPAGLGARDTLRLEAKMMLYGNDIDETTTVLEADLGWMVKFEKPDFLGKEALLKQKEEGIKRKIVGFEVKEKGIARPHYPVFINGNKVSEVTSGTFAPYLKKSIGLTYLPIEYTEIGTQFEIGIRNHVVKAEVVPTPFYKRKK